MVAVLCGPRGLGVALFGLRPHTIVGCNGRAAERTQAHATGQDRQSNFPSVLAGLVAAAAVTLAPAAHADDLSSKARDPAVNMPDLYASPD